MFRIGMVTVVDVKKRMARVRFPDVDIVSDWLPVLDHSSFVTLALKSDGKSWTVSEKHASADRELSTARNTQDATLMRSAGSRRTSNVQAGAYTRMRSR